MHILIVGISHFFLRSLCFCSCPRATRAFHFIVEWFCLSFQVFFSICCSRTNASHNFLTAIGIHCDPFVVYHHILSSLYRLSSQSHVSCRTRCFSYTVVCALFGPIRDVPHAAVLAVCSLLRPIYSSHCI